MAALDWSQCAVVESIPDKVFDDLWESEHGTRSSRRVVLARDALRARQWAADAARDQRRGGKAILVRRRQNERLGVSTEADRGRVIGECKNAVRRRCRARVYLRDCLRQG